MSSFDVGTHTEQKIKQRRNVKRHYRIRNLFFNFKFFIFFAFFRNIIYDRQTIVFYLRDFATNKKKFNRKSSKTCFPRELYNIMHRKNEKGTRSTRRRKNVKKRFFFFLISIRYFFYTTRFSVSFFEKRNAN